MADISEIVSFDGNTFKIKDATARRHLCEYIRGTQNTQTNAWSGTSIEQTIQDGKQIAYYLPYSGNGDAVTLNLMLLNGVQTGAKPILKHGQEPVTAEYPAGSVIRLTWIEDADAWVADSISAEEVTSYSALSDKPKICSVTLEGDKTFEQLGLESLTNTEIEAILRL